MVGSSLGNTYMVSEQIFGDSVSIIVNVTAPGGDLQNICSFSRTTGFGHRISGTTEHKKL